MAVVIGMSIYVVHYKEFRFRVNGRDFVNDEGDAMRTDEAKYKISDISKTANIPSDQLSDLKSITFFATLPEGDAEIELKIAKVVRFTKLHVVEFHGNAGDYLRASVDPKNATTPPSYIDGTRCPSNAPCVVVNSQDSLRRMLSEAHPHMRRLGFWDFISSWFGGSSSKANLKYAPRCSNGDTEIFSDYQPRWEYSSCSCRWRWWNCGDGKAKHVRACQEPNGDRYNLVYETCQTIPEGASPKN